MGAMNDIDKHMSSYAKGQMTASDLRKVIKKIGYDVDSLRGNNSEITLYKIGGSGRPIKKSF